MGHADVFALCQLLGGNLPDPTQVQRVYADVVQDVAASTELIVQLSLIDHDANQDTFDTPVETLVLLAVFYDGQACWRETQRGLEAISAQWRSRRGVPRSFIVETEGDRRFRLFPTPTSRSADFIPTHGDLLGRDLPTGTIEVLTSVSAADVPVEYELPIALLVLGRLFALTSAIQDLDFAKRCTDLGTALLQALLTVQHP